MISNDFSGRCNFAICEHQAHKAFQSRLRQLHDTVFDIETSPVSLAIGYNEARRSMPSRGSNGPLACSAGIWVFFVGRLHNASMIARKFSYQQQEASLANISELLAYGFKALGTELFGLLQGEYSLAIWDSFAGKFYLLRDKLGQFPAFYIERQGTLTFGSRADQFSDLGFDTHLALSDIARFATQGVARIRNRAWFYQSIEAVEPGHYIVYDGDKVSSHRYFSLQFRPDVSKLSVEDANAEMRELLQKKMAFYLQNCRQAGLLFSGGLDSTALMSLALEGLHPSGQHLIAMTTADYDAENIEPADDAAYVRDYKNIDGLSLHHVRADEAEGPFSNIERVIDAQQSPLIVHNHYQYQAFGKAADAMGVDLVFDGVMGEHGPSFHGRHFALQALGSGKLAWLWQTLKAQRATTGKSIQQQIWQILFPLMRHHQKAKQIGWAVFLRPEFVHEYKDMSVKRKDGSFPWSHHDELQKTTEDWFRAMPLSGTIDGYMGSQRIYPFLDTEIIEFAMSAPLEAHVQHGYNRGLIRGAMAPYWSAKQRNRISKSPFAPDFFERYERQKLSQRNKMRAIPNGHPVREIMKVDEITNLLGRNDLLPQQVRSLISAVYMTIFLNRRMP